MRDDEDGSVGLDAEVDARVEGGRFRARTRRADLLGEERAGRDASREDERSGLEDSADDQTRTIAIGAGQVKVAQTAPLARRPTLLSDQESSLV